MNNFYFDEEAHEYFIDGEKVPSVTQVLSPLNDFSMIAPEVLQHAADRGTAVHKAVELFCANNLDEDSICDEIKPYFAAFKQFYAEKKPKIIWSERRVYHSTERYIGTMDLLLEIPKLTFVDIKCTAQISKTAPIQLLAYQRAAIDMTLDNGNEGVSLADLQRADRATLWLKKTGKYQFVSHPADRMDDDRRLFQTLLNKIHAETAANIAIENWKRKTK